MNKLNKATKMAVVLLSVASINAVSYANNNAKNTRSTYADTVDMQLNIDTNENGKISNLSIYNASSSNAFQLKLKIDGDVDFKGIDFSDHLKQNAITKSNFDKSSKILDITATSDVDLVKGGVLDIGTLTIEGSDDITYTIKDTEGIIMTNSTYDEIADDNLEEIGDTSITIGVKTELPEEDDEEDVAPPDGDDSEDDNNDDTVPPVEDDKEEDNGGVIPPVEDEEDTVPPVEDDKDDEEETVPPVDDDKDDTVPPVEDDKDEIPSPNPNPSPTPTPGDETEDEDKLPSTDNNIEESQSSDGTKLLIPKTKDALNTILERILAMDKDAKIVDIKETSEYFIYRVKYKNNARDNSEYTYVDIKVSKDISDKKELPGIAFEDTNTTPDNDNGGNNNNNNNNNNTNSDDDKETDSNKKPQTSDSSAIGYIAGAGLSAVALWFLNRKKKNNNKKED